jgi:hypothetical protein
VKPACIGLLLLAAMAGTSAEVFRSPRDVANRQQPYSRVVSASGVPQSAFQLVPFRYDALALRTAARRELAASQDLVGEDTYRDLGLASVTEASQLELGEPMTLYELDLDDLTRIARGESLRLKSTRQVLVPLKVGKQTRAGLVLRKRWVGWEAVNFGFGAPARRLTDLRQQQARLTGLPLTAFAAVSVPRLEVYLLSWMQENRLRLIPTRPIQDLKLEALQAQDAGEVVSLLLPALRGIVEESSRLGRPLAR